MTRFDRFASGVTRWAGSPIAFCVALLTVLVWAALGPLFHFSENWQLVFNTGTTIVTFLMVFLIQQSQNKDSVAVHLRLNELLASNKQASNRMIGIEDVAMFYVKPAERAKTGGRTRKYIRSTTRACRRRGRRDSPAVCTTGARLLRGVAAMSG